MRYRGKYEAVPVRQKRKKGSIHLQMMVTSAVSFVLCCSMLLGTTMAWFTDTITSSPNQIIIGELKVDVLYNGNSLRNSTVPVFGGSGNGFVWQPKGLQIRELVVENQGNLDLNYSLTFLSDEENLSAFEYFDVYVKHGDDLSATYPEVTQEQDKWEHIATLADILKDKSIPVFAGCLEAGENGNKSHHVYSIALVMRSDVTDTSIQGSSLRLYIQLHASQVSAATEPTTPPAVTETEAPVEGGQTE